MAPCGSASGAGSKTPLNSAIGAVPLSCEAEAITMKRWIKEKTRIPPYPPMIFLVILVFGARIIRSQRYCGPKVARLNACLMFSLERIDVADDDNIDVVDSIAEIGSNAERAEEDRSEACLKGPLEIIEDDLKIDGRFCERMSLFRMVTEEGENASLKVPRLSADAATIKLIDAFMLFSRD